MKFGICCGLSSFAPQVQDQPLSSIPHLMDTLVASGADYVEFTVGSVLPEQDEQAFAELRDILAPFPLKIEAFNSFLPGSQRITGPHVDTQAVLNYCRTALTRCKALGGDVVVLGSAKARSVPEGFDKAVADKQFVEFCRELGPVAQEIGITITIEPLNSREDNLVLSVAEGARIVDEVAHPSIQLLADLYHMTEESERIENVGDAGARLRHTHVADLGRVAPGYAPNGEADFLGFFRELRRAGYDALPNPRCSFEGSFEDIEKQAKPTIDLMRRRWEESAAG